MIVSVIGAQRDEVEEMEICDSICEKAQKGEMEKMEIFDSICEQGTEGRGGKNGDL